MEFKPAKEQVLQAFEDREEGRPLSKDMEVYLDRLDRDEQANAQAAQDSNRFVRRVEKVNQEMNFWKNHYQDFRGRPLPEGLERELRKDLNRRN